MGEDPTRTDPLRIAFFFDAAMHSCFRGLNVIQFLFQKILPVFWPSPRSYSIPERYVVLATAVISSLVAHLWQVCTLASSRHCNIFYNRSRDFEMVPFFPRNFEELESSTSKQSCSRACLVLLIKIFSVCLRAIPLGHLPVCGCGYLVERCLLPSKSAQPVFRNLQGTHARD